MHFLQAINSDISVRIVCNKTGGTMKGDTKKIICAIHKWRLFFNIFKNNLSFFAPFKTS